MVIGGLQISSTNAVSSDAAEQFSDVSFPLSVATIAAGKRVSVRN
jgi:hypothetical protein